MATKFSSPFGTLGRLSTLRSPFADEPEDPWYDDPYGSYASAFDQDTTAPAAPPRTLSPEDDWLEDYYRRHKPVDDTPSTLPPPAPEPRTTLGTLKETGAPQPARRADEALMTIEEALGLTGSPDDIRYLQELIDMEGPPKKKPAAPAAPTPPVSQPAAPRGTTMPFGGILDWFTRDTEPAAPEPPRAQPSGRPQPVLPSSGPWGAFTPPPPPQAPAPPPDNYVPPEGSPAFQLRKPQLPTIRVPSVVEKRPDVGSGYRESVVSAAEAPDRGPLEAAKDLAIKAVSGTVSLVDAAMALDELASAYGNKALGLKEDDDGIKGIAALVKKHTGWNGQQIQEWLDTHRSPESLADIGRVERARKEGPGAVTEAILQHPFTAVESAVESVPGMIAGGVVGRSLPVSPLLGGAIGEGSIAGAQNVAQYYQETGQLPDARALAAIGASAILTGVVNRAFAGVAQKFGYTDVDSLMVGVRTNKAARTAVNNILTQAAKLPLAMTSEGAEEMLQTAPEAVAMNLAQGKPWNEGIGAQTVESGIVGAVMGGGGHVVEGGLEVTEQTREDRAKRARDAHLQSLFGTTAEPSVADLVDKRRDLQTARQSATTPEGAAFYDARIAGVDRLIEEKRGKPAPTVDQKTQNIAKSRYAELSTEELANTVQTLQADRDWFADNGLPTTAVDAQIAMAQLALDLRPGPKPAPTAETPAETPPQAPPAPPVVPPPGEAPAPVAPPVAPPAAPPAAGTPPAGTPPPTTIDLTGMGGAISDNLYRSMLERLQAGKLPEPFEPHQQSAAAQAVKAAWDRGEIQTIEDVKRVAHSTLAPTAPPMAPGAVVQYKGQPATVVSVEPDGRVSIQVPGEDGTRWVRPETLGAPTVAGAGAAPAAPAPAQPGGFDPAAAVAALPENEAELAAHPLARALTALGDLRNINGLIPTAQFTPEEAAAIQAAGVPVKVGRDDGRPFEGFEEGALWKIHDAFQQLQAARRAAAPPPPVAEPTAPTAPTAPTEPEAQSLPGWLGALPEDRREAVFAEMRRIFEIAEYHADQSRKLTPPYGTIGVGMADKAEFQQSESRHEFLRALRKGATPQEANAAGKSMSRLIAEKTNSSRPKDIHSHLPAGAVDASLDDHTRSILRAAAPPAAAPEPAAPTAEPAAPTPAPTGEIDIDAINEDDILAALAEALGPKGPQWRAGSPYDTPDNPAAEALAQILEEQTRRRIDIAGLADQATRGVAAPGLDQLQAEYDEVWKELEQHMDGIDVRALDAQVEQAAKVAIEEERAARTKKQPAKEPAKTKPEPAPEKRGEDITDDEFAAFLREKLEPAAEAEPAKEEEPAAPKATKAEKPAKAEPTEADQLAEERARIEAENADLVRQIKEQLNRLSANAPLDPAITVNLVKLARNYVRLGIVKFREAALRLRQDFGDDARADQYFELAWPMAQEIAKGATLAEAYERAMAQVRPTVADAIAEAEEAEPEAEEEVEEEAEEVPRGPRRRFPTNAWYVDERGSALEGAVSAKAQAGIARLFKSFANAWDMRHIREAMEAYEGLVGRDDADAEAARQGLIDAFNDYFTGEPTRDQADAVDAAAFRALQVVTGQEDPDWGELLERNTFATAREQGQLVFNTLDPKTASFDMEEWNTAFGEVEWRRDGETLFPEPKDGEAVNLWKGRPYKRKGEWVGLNMRNGVPVLSQEEGARQLEAWKAAAKAAAKPENAQKVIISLYDRTGIISQPWADAGYSVRRFDIRPAGEGGTAEDLTDFGKWMNEIEHILDQGYRIVGVLAQPPCTSFTDSGAQHWPRHDEPGYIDKKTGLTWLERTYGKKAAEHFDTPTEYAQTLVAIVKLIVAQSNPRFYMMENPAGRIDKLNGLPEETLKFNPDDYGEAWTKETRLWGEFNPNLPTARVGGMEEEGGEGSRVHKYSSSQKKEREATPIGFAYAFFMANQALAQEEWENQERPANYEPELGEKYVPEAEPTFPEPTEEEEADETKGADFVFRSGNQQSPADIAGFIAAGQPVGVTALGMTGPVREQLVKYVAEDGGVAFIDSGAFGKTRIVEGRGVPNINFQAVMSAYGKLATDVVNAGGNADGLFVVAPDVAPAFVNPNNRDTLMKRTDGGVPRSFPDETKLIQDQYADQITAALDAGMKVVVPVQVGPTMAARAVEVAQQFPGAMIGLPGNQGAISDDQFSEMLSALSAAEAAFAGFHFLGIGAENARLEDLVDMVREVFPEVLITSDSSRAQSYFGTAGSGKPRKGSRIAGHLTDARARELMDDVTELTPELYSGNLGEFTTDELNLIVDTVGAGSVDTLLKWIHEKQEDPDLHPLDRHAGDPRIVDGVLFQIAYQRGLNQVDDQGVRTTAIQQIETEPTPEREAIIEALIARKPAPPTDAEGLKQYTKDWKARDAEFRDYLQSLTDEELEAEAALYRIRTTAPESRPAESQPVATTGEAPPSQPAVSRPAKPKPKGTVPASHETGEFKFASEYPAATGEYTRAKPYTKGDYKGYVTEGSNRHGSNTLYTARVVRDGKVIHEYETYDQDEANAWVEGRIGELIARADQSPRATVDPAAFTKVENYLKALGYDHVVRRKDGTVVIRVTKGTRRLKFIFDNGVLRAHNQSQAKTATFGDLRKDFSRFVNAKGRGRGGLVPAEVDRQVLPITYPTTTGESDVQAAAQTQEGPAPAQTQEQEVAPRPRGGGYRVGDHVTFTDPTSGAPEHGFIREGTEDQVTIEVFSYEGGKAGEPRKVTVAIDAITTPPRLSEKETTRLRELNVKKHESAPQMFYAGKGRPTFKAMTRAEWAELEALEQRSSQWGSGYAPTYPYPFLDDRPDLSPISKPGVEPRQFLGEDGAVYELPEGGELTIVKAGKPKPEKKAAKTTKAAARETYADGRLVPMAGDKVYQPVRGFGGTPAYVHGEVYAGKKGELRVRITGSAAFLGSTSSKGKTQKLDEAWIVVDDPEITRRREAREQAEADRKAQMEREEADFQAEIRRKAQAAIAGGHQPLTRDTPIGSPVVDHYSGETGTVDGQTEYGPLIDGRTLGNPDADGTWGGYSVFGPPTPLPYSRAAMATAFNLTDEEAAAADVLREQLQISEDSLQVAKGGIAGDGALRQVLDPDRVRELRTLRDRMRYARGSQLAARHVRTFLNTPIENLETGIVATVSRESRDEMLSKKSVDRSFSPQAHMTAVANVDLLFRVATRSVERPSRKDPKNVESIQVFDAPLPFDGDVLRARILTKVFRDQQNGTRIYFVEAVEISPPKPGGADRGGRVAGAVDRVEDAPSSPEAPPLPAGDHETTFAQMVALVKGTDTLYQRRPVPRRGGETREKSRVAMRRVLDDIRKEKEPPTSRPPAPLPLPHEFAHMPQPGRGRVKSAIGRITAQGQIDVVPFYEDTDEALETSHLEHFGDWTGDRFRWVDEGDGRGGTIFWTDRPRNEDHFQAVENRLTRKGMLVTRHADPLGYTIDLPRILFQRSVARNRPPKTPAFKAWFGNSVVRLGNGQPRIVYHGSGAAFSAFEDRGTFVGWFAQRPEGANLYAEGRGKARNNVGVVYPVYLSLQKPLDLTALDLNDPYVRQGRVRVGDRIVPSSTNEQLHSKLQEVLAEHGVELSDEAIQDLVDRALAEKEYFGYPQLYQVVHSPAFAELVRAHGFDGLVARERARSPFFGDTPFGPSEYSYAVLDPAQIKSAIGNRGTFDPNEPNIAYQGVQGATEFAKDGQAIIRGFAAANFSTAAHELFHVARRQRLNRNVPAKHRGGITDNDLDVFEEWAGVKEGVWTEAAEEKAARGFERYLRDGAKFANPTIQKVFDKIRDWMTSIYLMLDGSPLDIEISPAVRAVFDKLVGAQLEEAAKIPPPTPRPVAARGQYTTPGTRLSWTTGTEWAQQAEVLRSGRGISAKVHRDRKSHLEELAQRIHEMIATGQTREDLEAIRDHVDAFYKPPRGQRGGTPYELVINNVNNALARLNKPPASRPAESVPVSAEEKARRAEMMAPVIAASRDRLARTGADTHQNVTVKILRDTPESDFRVEVVRRGDRSLLPIHYAKAGNAINAAMAELYGGDWDTWWAANKPNPHMGPGQRGPLQVGDTIRYRVNASFAGIPKGATAVVTEVNGDVLVLKFPNGRSVWARTDEVEPLEDTDAIQEPGAAEGPVREGPGGSEEVRAGDTEGGEAAGAGAPQAGQKAVAKSWKAEITDGSGWSSNGLRFATREEAEASGREIFDRWFAAKDIRVVESDDPVNYARVNGENVPIEERASAPELTAMEEERAKLEAEREKLKAESEELIKQLRGELGRIGTGTALDPKVLGLVLKLTKNYVKQGIVAFKDAALMFRQQMGEHPTAEHYFELAWPAFQEMLKGKQPKEAVAIAQAIPNRPTVKAAVAEAYTEPGGEGGERGERPAEPEAEPAPDRPGAAEPGGDTADTVRDGRTGLLGEVSPEAGGGTEGTGPVEAGGSHPPSGGPTAVSGEPGAGAQPEPAPGPSGGTVPAGSVPTAGGTAGPVGIRGDKPEDYQLTPERIAGIIDRGTVQRFKDNVAAIRLVKDLQSEHRYATPDEQELLAKYVGWGATEIQEYLEDRPRANWSANEKATWQELQSLTTKEQRAELRRSSPNAHFTFDLYRPIWNALAWFGFPGGRVLEPAVGTGHALGFMAPTIRKNSTISASELDPTTAAMASYLYPSARIQPVGYEKIRLPRNTQDLVISNVPFGRFGVEDKTLSAFDFLTKPIHNYFFAKALEHVRPGGYIVFLTSRFTMDASTGMQLRRYLMSKAHFVGAVRLPGGDKGAFATSAKTQVVTDLIVLQKFTEGEREARNGQLFINSPKHEGFSTPEGKDWRGRKVPAENVYRSAWYETHPQFILGTESMTGTMYPRYRVPDDVNPEADPDAPGVQQKRSYTVEARHEDPKELRLALEDALRVILPKDSYQPATTPSTEPDAPVAEGAFKPGELRVGTEPNTIQRVLLDGQLVDATPKNKKGEVDLKEVRRTVGLIGIRDARRAVVEAMRSPTATDAEFEGGKSPAQKQLLKAYKAFVEEYGSLNTRENRRAFKLDPESSTLRGLEIIKPVAKTFTNKKGEKTVKIVEEVVGLADIFDKRTINVSPEITHVDTPQDALLASLGVKGKIDWGYMAHISGDGTVTPERITELQYALRDAGAIFEQPDGAWTTRDEYLSGDVVSKLADAAAAAEDEPDRFRGNVEALTPVQPKPKTAEEIQIALGVHWVQPEDIATFVDQSVGARGTEMRLDGAEQYIRWTGTYPDHVVAAAARHPLAVRYGEHNEKVYDFTRLMDDALNLKLPDLGYYVKEPDGSRTFISQPEQTTAARANLDELRTLWMQWAYGNPQVLARTVDTYNTRYNRTVERQYDGSHLANYVNEQGQLTDPKEGGVRSAQLPGLMLPFALYPHQLRAIWRVLTSGNTLLAHEVGAGKTFEMIVTAMEMRRTGRARKPMITVPTHLLPQWKRDILKAYPTAKLLAFDDDDLSADRRQEAMSRIAHGDWDMVLVPHSSFGLLQVSKERMAATLQEWVDQIVAVEAALRATHGKKDPSVKKIEDARRRIEEKIRKLLARVEDKKNDNALVWEDLGVDALFVDEAHAFKNLFFFSKLDNIRGISRSTSNRALDMFIKIKEINEASNYRNLVFATATPVMNTLAEVYTMQRYLQPDRLRDLGFENFDNWYATFAQANTTIEQLPDGTYKEVQRVSEFRNVKLLYRVVAEVMDYVGWDDMPYLKLPKLKDNKVTIVQTEQHSLYPTIREWFTRRLAAIRATPPHVDRATGEFIAPDRFHPITNQRMVNKRGEPVKDLILTVMNDARLAAIDSRLVLGEHAQDVPGSRLQTVAQKVADYYKRERKNKGVALIFLDVGTPQKATPMEFLEGATGEEEKDEADEEVAIEADEEGGMVAPMEGGVDFNLYEALKQALIARGVKSKEIAFIHQAPKSSERLALFQALQEGTVRVLVASTEKGATGMNIQDRLGLVAEFDAPKAMRPGDINQRHGRAIRQGNTYPEIEILRFVTKGSTDEWLYGLLAKKQTMIRQFMKGELDYYKDEDDPRDKSLEEAEIYASEDKRKIELLQLRTSLPRLAAQAAAAERAQAALRYEADMARRNLPVARAALETLQAFIRDSFKSVAGDAFEMTIGETHGVPLASQIFHDRAAANKALIEAMKPLADQSLTLDRYVDPPAYQKVGEIRGLPILARPLFSRFSGNNEVNVVLDASAAGEGEIRVGDLSVGSEGKAKGTFGEGRNIVASITDRYNGLPHAVQGLEGQIRVAEEAIARAEQPGSDAPRKIAEAQRRIAQIESELRAESAIKEEEAKREHEADVARRRAEANSEGDYAEIPTEDGPVFVQVRPIEFPELVKIAKMLQAIPQVVKRFRKEGVRGSFSTEHGIRLKADLFKKENVQQLAATLAHEIGHLVDWLPDRVLQRGNILGRLRSLQGFLKGTYTAADGSTISNEEVRAELIALSAKWRPWDRKTASESFREYRDSSEELYADALSAILNKPKWTAEQAPIFFQQFMEELDRKPEVKRAFFDIWELMSGSREELLKRREEGIDAMFAEANAKAVDLLKLKQRQRELNQTSAVAYFKDLLDKSRQEVARGLGDQHWPFIERIRRLKPGEEPAPEDNPYYALSERSYRMAGQVKAFVQRYVQPIFEQLNAHNLTWVDFGKFLMYERIIQGDRQEIANPDGLSPESAKELYDRMLRRLSPKQRAVLRTSADTFRGAVKDVAREAYELGLFTDAQMDLIEKNPAYVTFQTIEHLDDPISSRIYHQLGTLKDIRNPADATVLKTIVTLRAMEHNRAKTIAINFLKTQGEAPDAPQKRGPGGKLIIEPAPPGLELVTYFKKGKFLGVYVDPVIAESLQKDPDWQVRAITRIVSELNSTLKKTFTTWLPGFQSFNLIRDFLSFWRKMTRDQKRNTLKSYWRGRHFAAVRAYGLASPEASAIRKVYRTLRGRPAISPTATELQAWEDMLEAERSGAISVTTSDALRDRDIEMEMIKNIMASAGVSPILGQKAEHRAIFKPWFAYRDAMENISNFIESLPKGAALYEFKGKGEIADIPPELRHHIRAIVGSPDFYARGTWTPVTNNLFLFSNAMIQGTRSDWQVFRGKTPTTRMGYLWRLASTTLLPKGLYLAAILAAAGAAGGDDDDDEDDPGALAWARHLTRRVGRGVKRALAKVPYLPEAGRLLRKVPEYDLTNYIVIPWGEDEHGNVKALRFPTDDTSKMLGGFWWKFLKMAAGDRQFMRAFWDMADYTQGQIPSQTPLISVPATALEYASGRNPRDYYRGRDLFTQQQQLARAADPTWFGDPFQKFAGFEAQQLGAGAVYKFYMGDERPTQKSTRQKIIDFPVLSDTVGRFVKITKYGEIEKNRQAGEQVRAQRAYRSENEKRAVQEALPKYWALPKGAQNLLNQERFAREIARELYPNERDATKRQENERRLKQKFTLSVLHGEADALAEPVLSAQSNDEKVAIIVGARPQYTDEEFKRWLSEAARQKVISPQVVVDVNKRLRELAVH